VGKQVYRAEGRKLKVKSYSTIQREVDRFLGKHWREVFEVWWSCVEDVGRSLEEAVSLGLGGGSPTMILYDAGARSGMQVYRWLSNSLKLGARSVKEKTLYTDAFFTRSGMARGVEFLKEGGRNILRYKGGTIFARKRGVVGRRVCHYTAGFIAGATRLITGKEYIVEEVRCFSNGEKDCDFWVKPFGLTAGA